MFFWTHWDRHNMGAILRTFWMYCREWNVWTSIKISLKFIPKGPINNTPVLVQIMAWRRSGDKPLSEPMMARLLAHICVTRPLRVNPYLARGHGVEPFQVFQRVLRNILVEPVSLLLSRCKGVCFFSCSLPNNELKISVSRENVIFRRCHINIGIWLEM